MSVLGYLIPLALCLGLVWIVIFMWSLKSGQYDDLEGSANRILFDEEENLENLTKVKSGKKRKK